MAKERVVKHFTIIEYVKRFYTMNCGIDLMVYIEDEFAALENVGLGLIDESMLAYTRARLRPKGTRTTQHFGRRRWTQNAPEDEEILPDLARETGKQMKISAGPFEPTYKAGSKMMWIIADEGAQALYLLLLIKLVKNYLYESLHLLSTDARSHCAEGWANGKIRSDTNVANAYGTWSPVLAFDEIHVYPPNFNVSDRIFAGPGLHRVFWGMTIKNLSHIGLLTVTPYIGDQFSGKWLSAGEAIEVAPQEYADIIIAADSYPEGEVLMWLYAKGDDYYEARNVSMNIWYQGPAPTPPKPPKPDRPKKNDAPRGHGAPYKRRKPRKPYKLKMVKYRA